MVQFGVKLKANMVEKWREHYVDYTRLKGYIKRYAKEQKGEQVTPAKSKAGGGGGGTAGAKPAPDLEMAPPLGGGTNSSTAGTTGSTTSSTSIASPTSTRRPPKRMGYKSLPPVDLESPGGDRDLDLRADSGTEELLRRHTGLDGDHFGPLTASTRTPSGHLALVDTLKLSEGEMEIGCTRAFVEELTRVSLFYDTKTLELREELRLLRSAQTGKQAGKQAGAAGTAGTRQEGGGGEGRSQDKAKVGGGSGLAPVSEGGENPPRSGSEGREGGEEGSFRSSAGHEFKDSSMAGGGGATSGMSGFSGVGSGRDRSDTLQSDDADTGHDDVHTGHDDEPARGRSETFIRPKPETHHARMTVSLLFEPSGSIGGGNGCGGSGNEILATLLVKVLRVSSYPTPYHLPLEEGSKRELLILKTFADTHTHTHTHTLATHTCPPSPRPSPGA